LETASRDNTTQAKSAVTQGEGSIAVTIVCHQNASNPQIVGTMHTDKSGILRNEKIDATWFYLECRLIVTMLEGNDWGLFIRLVSVDYICRGPGSKEPFRSLVRVDVIHPRNDERWRNVHEAPGIQTGGHGEIIAEDREQSEPLVLAIKVVLFVQ
jgi:hypothetical protein